MRVVNKNVKDPFDEGILIQLSDHWMSLEVLWDHDPESEQISPWEVTFECGKTLVFLSCFSIHYSAPSTSREATSCEFADQAEYHPTMAEWATCAPNRLCNVIERLVSLERFEPLMGPSETYGDFAAAVGSHCITLDRIDRRLVNGVYRRLDAAMYDVERLVLNAIKATESTTAQQARVFYEVLYRFVK